MCPAAGFDDPEVMAAVAEVARDPKAFAKYANNPKVGLYHSSTVATHSSATAAQVNLMSSDALSGVSLLVKALCESNSVSCSCAVLQVQQFYMRMGNLVGSRLEKMGQTVS